MNPNEQWVQETSYVVDQGNGQTIVEGYNENLPINDGQYVNYSEDQEICVGVAVENQRDGNVPVSHIPGEKDHHLAFILRNLHQVKSLTAGLLLLCCSGMHILWAIYHGLFFDKPHNMFSVWFAKENKLKEINSMNFGLVFSIVSWYAGAMIGSAIVGFYILPQVRKKNIYFIASGIMILSAICYGLTNEDSWHLCILFGRFFAGIGHGFVLVTVFVQASENSSKGFREMLVIIIGSLMMFSIFLASLLINLPLGLIVVENVAGATSAHLISICTIILALASIKCNISYTLESVPFLLKHNYKDEESLYVFSAMRNEPVGNISAGVVNDYEEMRAMYQADFEEFGDTKVFKKLNRPALFNTTYSRIVGMMMSSLPAFLVTIRHLLNYYEVHEDLKVKLDMDIILNETTAVGTLGVREEGTSDDWINRLIDSVSSHVHKGFIYALVLLTISCWSSSGSCVTFFANKYNWRKGFYEIVAVFGLCLLAFCLTKIIGLGTHFMASLMYLLAFILFLVLSWPVNIFGYFHFTDAFPITLHASSIAVVTIAEYGFHILFIVMDLYLSHTVNCVSLFVGIIFTIFGFKLYRRTSYTKGLSLRDARLENQRVLLTETFHEYEWMAILNRLF